MRQYENDGKENEKSEGCPIPLAQAAGRQELVTGESGYVHGYTLHEEHRLRDQAQTLAEILHHDSIFAAGERVLEAGCGTGAQTAILATRNRGANFTCIDLSPASLAKARDRVMLSGLNNVSFRLCDVHDLPFRPHSFDQAFVCFSLSTFKIRKEHSRN